MTKIHQLPEDLIARIAAGEVVERPASVLKELIENSLDAGATQVSVIIEGAGRTRLQVSDNGGGMSREEASLALRRHCTSKISQLEDLESLTSYGFRGEALPSICAVSRFRIATRVADEEIGWELMLDGGKLVSEKPVAREPGTTIEVRDLFFNTPARFKFMKADFTERSQCLRVVEEMAFASPDVTFHVQSEQAKPSVFQSGETGTTEQKILTLEKRIVEAWGSKWAEALIPVSGMDTHFSVYGLVSHPHHHTSSSREQFLFVNRRPVTNRRLTRAIYDGFLGQLPSQRHPAWVLFLDVNPQSVDVNVHPSKREVKLAFESEIYGFLLSAVRRALQPKQTVTVSTEPRKEFTTFAPPERKSFGTLVQSAVETLYRPLSLMVAEPQLELGGIPVESLEALAQVKNTFIVAQSEEGLVLVDQHAAAEKVLYERLMSNLKSAEPEVQMLLVPFSWEVSLSVTGAIQNRLEAFAKLGFGLEPFGGNTFLVKSHPAVLGAKFDLHSMLDGLSDVLLESSDRRGGLENDFEHRLAAMTACKASVKAGDALELPACQSLLDQLRQCEAPSTCPHGRPTMFRITFDELARRFKRT